VPFSYPVIFFPAAAPYTRPMHVLDKLLIEAVNLGADSLQFRPGQPPLAYVSQKPHRLGRITYDAARVRNLLESVLSEADRASFVGTGQIDAHYVPDTDTGLGPFELRVRRTPQGPAVALRATTAQAAPALSIEPTGTVKPQALAPPIDSVVHTEAPASPDDPGIEWGWPTHSVRALLEAVVERGASDLILSSGANARVRHKSGYQAIDGAIWDDAGILESLGDEINDRRRATLEAEGSVDLAYEFRSKSGQRCRFRVNLFRQMNGLAVAFRPIWERVPSPSTLHLPPNLMELADYPYGLVLITGPTGSGKSTTLSTMIEHINNHHEKHIITLEDPIEYLFTNNRSFVHQREVGVHVSSFSHGLRAALREAPDVILVGEMRDRETIAAALTAAETGHLVLSTLHSGSAAQAIDRIIDIFPEHQQSQVRIQISDVLRTIVTQRLLPRADGEGRVPAIELVRINYALSNLIRDKRTHQFTTQLQTGRKEGMVPFDQSLSELVRDGLITRETALRSARDRRYLETQLNNAG
jgi:twitching motility protein PilT